ncbi:MAG: hypothetical protein ABMA26_25030 [Limisphaerales bacterium]
MNQHDHPVWFVFPSWGEKPLPETGVFPVVNWDYRPFEGRQFAGEGGAAVEISMYGGSGFKAFHLPAKGRLELDGYSIKAWKDIDSIIVLEARELKVNGKAHLEKWLPYNPTCGEKVKVGSQVLRVDWKNLDWDESKNRSRDDYPKEKVNQVKAEVIRSWPIRLQPIVEKKTP